MDTGWKQTVIGKRSEPLWKRILFKTGFSDNGIIIFNVSLDCLYSVREWTVWPL